MTDIVDKKTRSRMMAGIKGKDTQPELVIRKALFAKGFRYRLHSTKIPGTPDIIFSRFRALIFINGCFWHGHDCHLFKWPSSNITFWESKIRRNQEKDKKNYEILKKNSWRILVVWECALKGRKKIDLVSLIEWVQDWLLHSNKSCEISGKGGLGQYYDHKK